MKFARLNEANTESKSCGSDATYICSGDTIIISGTGEISASEDFSDDHIKTIVLNSGITEIGDTTFEGCRNLVSIELPNTLVNIETSAFSECENLKYLTIPDSVVYIGYWVFSDCAKLSSIKLSKNLTSTSLEKAIGSLLDRCDQLKYIIYDGKFEIPEEFAQDLQTQGIEILTD